MEKHSKKYQYAVGYMNKKKKRNGKECLIGKTDLNYTRCRRVCFPFNTKTKNGMRIIKKEKS